MSSDGPRPGPRPGPPPSHSDDVKESVTSDSNESVAAHVTPPEEVDPETGTDAEGDPVENPSG